MGLFDALGELINGTARTAGNTVKTGLHAVNLDAESTVESVGDTVESAVDTVTDTIESLFD